MQGPNLDVDPNQEIKWPQSTRGWGFIKLHSLFSKWSQKLELFSPSLLSFELGFVQQNSGAQFNYQKKIYNGNHKSTTFTYVLSISSYDFLTLLFYCRVDRFLLIKLWLETFWNVINHFYIALFMFDFEDFSVDVRFRSSYCLVI